MTPQEQLKLKDKVIAAYATEVDKLKKEILELKKPKVRLPSVPAKPESVKLPVGSQATFGWL